MSSCARLTSSAPRPYACTTGASVHLALVRDRATRRGTIEPMVVNGSLELLVAADLDLVNMFGHAEWTSIRQALRTHFPEASVTSLPTAATFPTNHGAEHGDVLGTIQSALVLAHVRDSHLGEFYVSNPSRPRASARNGSFTTGNSSSDPPSIHGFGLSRLL